MAIRLSQLWEGYTVSALKCWAFLFSRSVRVDFLLDSAHISILPQIISQQLPSLGKAMITNQRRTNSSQQEVNYWPHLSNSKQNNFIFLGKGQKPFCKFVCCLLLNPLIFYGNQLSLQRFSYKNPTVIFITVNKQTLN